MKRDPILNAYLDPVYPRSTCLGCGDSYHPTRLEQKFCHRSCKKAASRAKYAARFPCVYCADEGITPPCNQKPVTR